MKEHLKEVCLCSEALHYSHLLPYISAYAINDQQIEEFKQVLEWAIKQPKKPGEAQIINWAGLFDLVVTDCRIHIMLPVKSFYLPNGDED